MITIQEPTGSAAEIDPVCGGTVRTIRLPQEVLYDPEPPHVRGCDTTLFAGRLLLPFADRIAGGRYRWRGTEYTLPLNDRELGDAIHGFLYHQPLEVVSQSSDRLTLGCELPARSGYPWALQVTVTYRVAPETFFLSVEVLNRGDSSAPLTVGWHPYFDAGPGATVQIAASRYIEADERLRLTGRRPPVEGSDFDFRRGRAIGAENLDVALELDQDAQSPVELTTATHRVQLTPAGMFTRVQLFTPPGGRGIALEPVSAPGEAFNDPSLGVTELAPGASVAGSVVVRSAAR
ncbi:MAG: hypothetical protein R6U25_06265 [Alkalispirochaeta sp.]